MTTTATATGIEPLIQCTQCFSLVSVKHLSSHDCPPLTQSNRFSQVSHYQDTPTTTTITTTDIEREHYSTRLKEIIKKRHSITSESQNVCCRCHHGNATILIAQLPQKKYHAQCINCFLCRKPITSKNEYQAFEGQIYCHDHFNMMMTTRPICATCHGTIESFVRPTIALDKYFHPEHIRCTICHKSVDPEMTGLVERRGKIYCRTDFNKLYLPKCEACQRPIEKEAVISLDNKLQGKWHKHCFHCQLCHTSFPDHKFYVYKNQPYCRLDYHKLTNTLCHGCHQIIEGHCIETTSAAAREKQVEVWKFHPSCFTCHTCQSTIHDEYFVHDNHIYCRIHHDQNTLG